MAIFGLLSYVLKTTKSLVNVLRLVDSDKVPGMRFIYGAIDATKDEIAKNLGDEYVTYSET